MPRLPADLEYSIQVRNWLHHLSQDPGDLRSLLEGLSAILELAATQLPERPAPAPIGGER